MSDAESGRLSAYFQKCRATPRTRIRYDMQGETDLMWKQSVAILEAKQHGLWVELAKWYNYDEPSYHQLQCCGINELNLEELHPSTMMELDDRTFDEALARFLSPAFRNYRDNRLSIVGLPVGRAGGGTSQYYFEFYKRIADTLERFGFREIATPYKNQNSNNVLRVFGVQKQ